MEHLNIETFSLIWYQGFAILFLCIFLMLSVGCYVSEKTKGLVLTGIGWLLLLLLIQSQYIYSANGRFDIKLTLPLSYCSIMRMCAIWAAIRKSKTAFEITLFFGILGPLLSFIGPRLLCPHNVFLVGDYYLGHALTIAVPIYMVFCMGFTPRKWSIYRVWLFMNVMLVLSYMINLELGSNYMFSIAFPYSTYPDYVWRWPFYLLEFQITLILFGHFLLGCFGIVDYIKCRKSKD